MYLIVTRSFPPELGGMQSLMWGLARELSKNFMIKVFADYIENHKEFDEQATFSIERVGGPKLLRKYRKAYLIDEFIKNGKINGNRLIVLLPASTMKSQNTLCWKCFHTHPGGYIWVMSVITR